MIWAKLIAWITGGGVKGLASELRQAHKDRLDAANDADRVAADERMNLVMSRVEAQTRGAGSAWAKIMRAAFALPFVIYIAKLVVWDKVLGWGTTDPLSPYLEGISWTIITFYFLDNTVRLIRS